LVGSRGIQSDTYLTLMDLAPTFLDVAGSKYPDDGSVQPLLGKSLLPLLSDGTAVHDDQYVTTMFHGGRAFIRQGRWKLVTLERPFDETGFELFDVEDDPGEMNDLSEAQPEKRAELIELWRAERKKLGIILPGDL